MKPIKLLSNNQLKIIALIAMTVDHVGSQLFPRLAILRIIGRLAFPIFAFMIAEGCTYTKNRTKHLVSIATAALLCQLVYLIAEHSLYQCIFVTFTLSVCLIYAVDNACSQKNNLSIFLAAAALLAVCFVSVVLPELLSKTDFKIDYGVFGILLPVFIYFAPQKFKLPVATLALLPLCISRGGVQWYSLLTIPILLLYNGKRGKYNIKKLFYIYYPTHLVVIYLISELL